MVHSMLTMLPEHLRSLHTTGETAQDTPEIARQWQRLRDRYKGDWYWSHFSKATALLLQSTDEYYDTVGDIYMEFGYPSKGSGQFFTPFHLAKMMASVQSEETTRLVYDRIKAAITGDPLAEAMLMAGSILEGEEAQNWLITKILPVIASRIEPVGVCDPSCGSGVMFLAVASTLPTWMTQLGLVQFSGMDIDQTCITMCQINIMLYGLNGHAIKCAAALTDPIGEPVQLSLPIQEEVKL